MCKHKTKTKWNKKKEEKKKEGKIEIIVMTKSKNYELQKSFLMWSENDHSFELYITLLL